MDPPPGTMDICCVFAFVIYPDHVPGSSLCFDLTFVWQNNRWQYHLPAMPMLGPSLVFVDWYASQRNL